MRKKLEKGAIAQLKSRIAQQNRAAGSNKNNHTEVIVKDDIDSDGDPNEAKDSDLIMNTGNGAVNPTQVQLNP